MISECIIITGEITHISFLSRSVAPWRSWICATVGVSIVLHISLEIRAVINRFERCFQPRLCDTKMINLCCTRYEVLRTALPSVSGASVVPSLRMAFSKRNA